MFANAPPGTMSDDDPELEEARRIFDRDIVVSSLTAKIRVRRVKKSRRFQVLLTMIIMLMFHPDCSIG